MALPTLGQVGHKLAAGASYGLLTLPPLALVAPSDGTPGAGQSLVGAAIISKQAAPYGLQLIAYVPNVHPAHNAANKAVAKWFSQRFRVWADLRFDWVFISSSVWHFMRADR